MQTKLVDVGWELDHVTRQLTPDITWPDTASFLDALNISDIGCPVHCQ